MKISKELGESLEKYEYFVPYVESYSAWSRQMNGVPSNYKCFLGTRILDPADRELMDTLPILTDEDARVIDLAAAKVVSRSQSKKRLFDLLVISGWDCVDLYFSFPSLRKLMKVNHQKFSVPVLEAKRRELIEAVRLVLIDFVK